MKWMKLIARELRVLADVSFLSFWHIIQVSIHKADWR